MRRLHRLLCALFALIMVASMIGCTKTQPSPNATPNTQPQSTSITVRDAMGRDITLPKKAERVVSIAPSNTEILFALGLDNAIVGVTDWCDYPAEAKQKEKVGDFSKPSIEKIVSLKPDLVLVASLHKETVEQLEPLGIPCFVLNAKTIAEVEAEIKAVGKLTGSDEAADKLVAQMEQKKKSLIDKLAVLTDKDKPLVYYEIWFDPITTGGPGSFHHELITLAGGKNIAAGAETNYPTYSLESLIAAQPEIMIYGHGVQSKEEIVNRAGWQTIPFIKSGRIGLVDENIISRPGPRIIDAVEMLAKTIHPELIK